MELGVIRRANNTLAKNMMIIFIAVYLAATPFDYMRNIGNFSYATKISMLGIIIFFVIDNLLCNQVKIKFEMDRKEIKKITIITFIFFLYMCLTMLISNVKISKTIEILSIFVQSFVFIFIILNISLEKKDIKRIENIWFILTGFFSLLMTTWNIYNSDRTALIVSQGTTDPNFYCATLIGPFLIGISRLINKNTGKKRIAIAILLINMILMIMISGSRGSLIGIIIGSFIYLHSYYKSKHKSRKILKAFIIIVFLVVLLIPFIPEETLERYSIKGIFSNGGSGRTDIWETAINYFNNSEISNKLLGNGIGSYRYTAGNEIFIERYGHVFIRENMFSHNIIITILIECGIVGLVIMCLLFKSVLKKLYNDNNKLPFCAVLGIIAAGMFIDIIYLRIFWAVIGYAIIYIKSYNMGEVNEESKHNNTSI